MNDADLWRLAGPIGGDGIEDEPEVVAGAGGEGLGGDRLGIDIGLTHADEGERHGLVLGDLMTEVVKENLDGDGLDGAAAGVLDMAVDVGDLAAGEVGGLTHLDGGHGEGGGVGVGAGGGGVDLGGGPAAAHDQSGDDDGGDEHDGDDEGNPVSF